MGTKRLFCAFRLNVSVSVSPGKRWQNALMRIQLIGGLPMASSAELYQLSWAIEQLSAGPRRAVRPRGDSNAGQ